ncbi:MAG TPA: YdeI/OmpD-associated family protein [Usitatibacter sp.]|nr:YdeI/OmpD-associated family protein [Usitatibacter sp.]
MIARVAAPANSLEPASRAQWRAWLERNHDRAQGVWLILHRVPEGKRGLLWMAPRKAGSGWSASHKACAERLAAAGKMAPPGRARIAAARRDGSWSALDAVESMEVPQDLARALDASGGAENFHRFPPSARRPVLAWIHAARRPATRAARVAETARLAAMNIRPPLWRKT